MFGMDVLVHRVVINDVTRLVSLACPQRPCQEAHYYPLRSALCDTSYTAMTKSYCFESSLLEVQDEGVPFEKGEREEERK